MGLTKQEDIWSCYECGKLQGRHDLCFDGDICEACHAEKQERDFYRDFHIRMKQQNIEQSCRERTGF